MSDQNFHEVQLTFKKLFFLFMCAVVVAAVIFSFGVSVGRGVRSASGQAGPTDVATDTTVPASADGPVEPATKPNEVSYAQALETRGPNPATVAPPPPPEDPTPAPPATGAPKSGTVPATAPAPKSTPPAKAPAAAAPASAPAPAAGGFIVQVEAFGANDIASREVAKLVKRGHPAFVFAAPEGTPGPRYKVQVGPFATRAEADKTIKALRTEGYRPLIKR